MNTGQLKVSIISVLVAVLPCFATARPQAKVTIRAQDENAKPVTDAQALVVFHKAKTVGMGLESMPVKGNTDGNGLFTARGASIPVVFAVVQKEGFYKSSKKLTFKKRSLLLNRWKPWNSAVELELKKKKHPVPMFFFRRVMPFSVPAYEEPIGFDLEEGDWVSPYGKGQRSDLIARLTRRFVSSRDHDITLSISFPNDGDGLQEYCFDDNDVSEFKWPYVAPAKGYIGEATLERHASKEGRRTNFDADKLNYLLRVRTVKDEDGNIESACYARMTSLGVGWAEKIRWKYWFNPDDKSRSLEYDPDQNLFKKH